MTNEFGIRLDRNGYAPSLLHDGDCFFCKAKTVARHEVFGGSRRRLSKRYGLWLTLCPICHEMLHHEADASEHLKRETQDIACSHYGWTEEQFINKFGKNYL